MKQMTDQSHINVNDDLLVQIKELSRKYNIERLVLFGSRARGDCKKTSDIDLAALGGNIAGFTLELEDTKTLLMFDVVDLDREVDEALLASIRQEGIIIYEKNR